MPLLPVPLLCPEELLTQSMWNTVSLAVQISAGVGGKRNLRRPSSPLPFPASTHLHGQFSTPVRAGGHMDTFQWIYFIQQALSYVPAGPCGLSVGYCGQRAHLKKQVPGIPKYLWLPGKLELSGGKIWLCRGLVGSRLYGRNHTPPFRIPPSSGRPALLSSH